MYILILTLITNYSGHPPTSSIESIPNFTTESSCLSMGNAWLKQQDQYAMRATALCAKQ